MYVTVNTQRNFIVPQRGNPIYGSVGKKYKIKTNTHTRRRSACASIQPFDGCPPLRRYNQGSGLQRLKWSYFRFYAFVCIGVATYISNLMHDVKTIGT